MALAVEEDGVTLPARFFRELLPAIRDLGELRITLALYHRVQTGQPLVAERELTDDPALRQGLVPLGSVRDPSAELRRGLELAVTRGTLLLLRASTNGAITEPGRWYTLNTAAGRELVAILTAQPERLRELVAEAPAAVAVEQPNIFRLYERHIAVLTPLVAQQLAEAVTTYPPAWIVDAFTEAVARERRSWRFIRHLLDRWASEGREQHGTNRRAAAQPLNPDKYTKGKYAHIFQR